ncbi:hypothetical protein Q9R08_05210 [Microbacterium sp. QXD-8]|uniref:Phage tail protein n=1 Tax=Microbacterium psychrotolerans TaxID=3068321 RepID=A0ABU0YYH0_9MICO|nr:hypothetical protein [Microbacterium sp. QXD-8]MDQ7877372.1 hypothetical protein [Microbacterium sp. QXD-8]
MLTLPAAVPSMGTRRVVFLPTVANIEAITLTEITAGENISCYLTRAGGWQPTNDQASVQDGRYCSAQDFEQPGTESRSLTIQYTFNLGTPTADEARLALEKGTTGILVHFLQIDQDEDTFAVGDWYEAVPVTMGIQSVMGVEDNAVDRIQQKAFVTGPWTEFKQLVAGG